LISFNKSAIAVTPKKRHAFFSGDNGANASFSNRQFFYKHTRGATKYALVYLYVIADTALVVFASAIEISPRQAGVFYGYAGDYGLLFGAAVTLALRVNVGAKTQAIG